jgi:xanthine dehydrogenase D subunit/xanthine dehydrogenase C subunit
MDDPPASAPRVLRASSLHEAADLVTRLGYDGRMVAGATALQLEWRRGARPPTHLIDLTALAELSGLSETASGELRIGAVTRLVEVERSQRVAERLPLLAETVRQVAAPGVRQLATIGGNIASGTGCLLPTLLALAAQVEVFDAGRLSKQPLREWLGGPAQRAGIIVSILVPPMTAYHRATHRKIGLRAAFTPSVIGAAGVLALDGADRISEARFAVGGGITPPQCLDRSGASIIGQPLETVDWQHLRVLIADEIDAPSDHFRSAGYRKTAAANALVAGLGGKKAIEEICGAARASTRMAPEPAAAPPEIEVSRTVLADRWRIRPDIQDKVAGQLAYLTDHRRPGMLVARILRAGVAHARIVSIDISAAEELPGVAAVVTANDIKGQNGFGIVVQDQPALCTDKVRYVGDAVAAVAAIDEATAARALALIRVDYEPLAIVDDMAAALAPGAPAVHASGNLQRELHFSRGDIDATWEQCAHIIEDTYITPRQMHGFMETEGGYVVPEADGTLSVCVGGQHGARDRMQLSRILAVPEQRIRVVTSPTGGAFGGKDELTVQPALALLALKSGRPVRLQLDRAESVVTARLRNPMRIRMRTGCDGAGRLIAQQVDLLSECGAYASLSPGVLETALEHACGPYEVTNVRTRGRLAYTNNGICGAFRGFGANQMTFAVESQVARLADAAGFDPIEFRRRNLRKPGSPGYLGQEVAPTERLAEMLDAAAASDLWRKPHGLMADGRCAIGVGLALLHQGNGLGSIVPDEGAGRLTLLPNGLIEAAFGLDEMGQGVVAIIQAAVAAAIGCDRDDVLPVFGDTARTPDSGSTTASRGTYVVWKAAALMGPDFSRQLRSAAGRALDRLPDELTVAPGGLRDARTNSGELVISFAALSEKLAPDARPHAACAFEFPKTDWQTSNARFIFAFGAALARVAVDRTTGEVRVLDLEQHTAAGPVLDPAGYLGQLEGGGVQGLGFTLTEDMILQAGSFVADNFDGYMLPTIADAPEASRVFALESLDDAYGPRGVGELGIGAVTPAIAAAVADAVSFWPTVTPIPSEDLLKAMSEGQR